MKIKTKSQSTAALTLTEVMLCIFILGLGIGSVLTGYIIVVKQTGWAVQSAAAQASALNAYERAMAMPWNYGNDCMFLQTNFPKTLSTFVRGTNIISVTTNTSAIPPYGFVRVDCVWVYGTNLVTNTVMGLRAPTL